MDETERALRQVEELLVRRVVEVHKSVALTLFQMLSTDSAMTGFSYGSPVWSGRYRANHNISIGNIDLSTTPEKDIKGKWPEPPSETYSNKPLSAVSGILSQLKPFDVIYIANNLPYARAIEYGHSKFKAPEGVYQVTVEALKVKYNVIS